MSGPSLTIDSTWLHAEDGSLSQPDSALVYTITALPHDGTLTVDGTTLALNGQFTQQQIDDGLMVYSEPGPTAGNDSFGFSISDTSSADLATGTFNIGTAGGSITSDFTGRTMTADASDVIFFSGPGRNLFSGSADTTTTVSYALAPAGVDVSIDGRTPTINGFGGVDSLTSIHNVIGSSNGDVFFSGPGTNVVSGGGGNDQIVGDPTVADASTTTAEYSGARSDYLVVSDNAVSAKIIDLRPGAPDGVDNVSWVQSFQFSDGSYTLAQLNGINEVEESGNTDVAEIGSNYFLYAHNTATGPELTYQGSPATDGQFGSVIGAEATAGGYEVVWNSFSTGTYTAWNVDSSGNYVSTLVGPITEVNAAFPSLETTLQQDLNGDRAIGAPQVTPIESFGSTTPTQVGVHYYLFANGTSSGPELKFGGPVPAGFFGTMIGAEQTASGYDVAWHNTDGTYTVSSFDGNGNYVSNLITAVAATDLGLETLETTFSQDLNGDGTIGIRSTVIEAFGSTELAQVGSDYLLNPVARGTGPELMYGGAPFVAAAWTPIGAEQTSTGYEVALFNASSHLYTIWNTDSSGNVLSTSLAGVSGASTALEAIEVSFHQDLNGDGTVGIPGVIESFGATQLMEAGNNYFFNPVAGGTGPELTYGGTPYVAAAWAPIGAEHTSTGYEVALFNASSSLYTVWNTDSNGNVLSSSISAVSGTNTALESIEVSFHQDLNGDGTIGIPGLIESFGTTQLMEVGNHYFFNPTAGGTGPELTYGGSPFVAAAWAPIGAEKTSAGYEVALFDASNSLYTVWNTDSSGNVLSSSISGVSGTNTALESIETSFQQDLNGDNVIGPASHTSAAVTTATITAASSGNAVLSGSAASDTFVFNAQFGNDTVKGFQPGVDQVALDHTLVASVADLFSHTADNAAGTAVVTIGADQSITFDDVSKMMLQQHANDFHLV